MRPSVHLIGVQVSLDRQPGAARVKVRGPGRCLLGGNAELVALRVRQCGEPRIGRDDRAAERNQGLDEPHALPIPDANVEVYTVLAPFDLRDFLEPERRQDAGWIDKISCTFSSLLVYVPERGPPERAQYCGIVGVDADFKVSRGHCGSVATLSTP
jgi:hypothetical protein